MENNNVYRVNRNGITNDNYINVSMHSKDSLGRKLALTATFNKVSTLIGDITSMRTAVDYITIKGYPNRLLTKSKLTAKDIKKIPKNKVKVINYNAILIHLLYERIMQDKDIKEQFINLPKDVIFTSFNEKKQYASGFNSTIKQYNDNAFIYINALNAIHSMLKSTDMKDLNKDIKELIIWHKEDKELPLFHGVPFDIILDVDI